MFPVVHQLVRLTHCCGCESASVGFGNFKLYVPSISTWYLPDERYGSYTGNGADEGRRFAAESRAAPITTRHQHRLPNNRLHFNLFVLNFHIYSLLKWANFFRKVCLFPRTYKANFCPVASTAKTAMFQIGPKTFIFFCGLFHKKKSFCLNHKCKKIIIGTEGKT